MKESRKGKTAGDKHPRWKGGMSEHYRVKHASRPKPEKCEICGALDKDFKKGLFYDHNHITNKFRGWICMHCNSLLGYSRDNIEILQKAINYLKVNV